MTTYDTRTLKRDDVVVEEGNGVSTFLLVLTCGPKTFDVIEMCGGTTRYRHADGRHVRLAVDSDYSGSGSAERDAAHRAWVLENLMREARAAREERRTGARQRRGHVSPRR